MPSTTMPAAGGVEVNGTWYTIDEWHAMNPSTGGGQTQTSAAMSGKAIVENVLAPLGLQSLADWAWDAWNRSGGSIDYVESQLPQQQAFKDRFPEYATLAAEGRAMSPAQIVQTEQQVAQLFQQYGIAGMPGYDTRTATQRMLEGDVSIGEMDSRLQLRMAAASQYHPDVAAQLERLGGPADLRTLTAYATDPKNALAMIQRQVTAAQIAARSQNSGFGQLTAGQAVGLAQQGVTDAQAEQGFGQIAQLNQLRGPLAGQAGAGVGAGTMLGAQFGGDAQAQQTVQAAQARQQGYFAQGGSFASTQSGVTGAGTASR